MKKILGCAFVMCLVLALLCGAATADLTANSANKTAKGTAKGPEYVTWLHGASNLTVHPSGLTAKLTWSEDSSGEADGYVVYQCLRSATEPTNVPYWWTGPRADGYYWYPVKMLGTTSGTSFTITAPSAGSYYIEVDSYYISPNNYISSHGEFATFTAGSSSVTAPKTVTATQPASNRVKLTWTAGENAKSYAIFRSEGSGSFKKIATTKKLTYTDKKVKNGKNYKYKIQAINGSKKANSSVVKAYPMVKPTSVKAKNAGGGSVTVSWKKVKGAKQYKVYQRTPGNSSYTLAATVKTTKAKISVYSGDGTYRYYVVPAVGTFEGLKSSKVSVSVTGAPAQDTVYRALLIGQTYSGTSSQLTACEYDRVAMKNMLENLTSTNYTGHIYNVKDGTKAEIMAAIDSVFSMADEDDVTIMYYTGHGVESSGDLNGALVGDDRQYIRAKELRQKLDQYKGRKVILLDSCFSGAMIGKDLDKTAAKSAARKYNASFIQAFYSPTRMGSDDLAAEGYFVITASSGEQTSSASNYWSLFTRAFLAGLGWDEYNDSRIDSLYADTNGDKKVTFTECVKYSKGAVDELENYMNSNYGWDVVMDVQTYPASSSNVFFGR